jgi:membrane protein
MAPLERASQFFQKDVWSKDLKQLSTPRAALYGWSRVLYLAVRGFLRDEGIHRASALAFDTVLGLVPFLAFCVSVLKGLGVYDDLMSDTARPWIVEITSAMGDRETGDVVTLRTAFFKILDFVERAEFGSLGLLGLALLLYITVLMLYSVETSMNHIFAAESERNVARKIGDYAAILFITPLCAAVAAGITTRARQFPWLGGGLVLQLTAALAMAFGLTMLYVVMPFTRVRLKSALFGGSVAGLLWYCLLVLHVQFQVGVARYNALYSTFAAIPIFLVWLFVSWLVVLFGAEITAAHQNTAAFRYRILGSDADQASRKFLALRAVAEVGRAFMLGEPPLKLSELSELLRVPDRLVREVLEPLVTARLLARAVRSGQTAYVPARDIDGITVSAIVLALERRSSKLPRPEGLADMRIGEIVDGLDAAQSKCVHNYTLRDLVVQTQDDSLERLRAPSLNPPSSRGYAPEEV